jgi:cyclophilin family peptidyl-prolyl cis-trans isomerase/HEAT repeat protein
MLTRVLFLATISTAAWAAPLLAQDPAQVEALAPLLMAEDRRAFDPPVLGQGLRDPDPLVRQTAATTVGRIGDRRGVALLVPLLADPSPTVVTATFFALGLIHDSSAVAAIAARLRSPDSLSNDAVGEAATALARIGGNEAARFLGSALTGTSDMPFARRMAFAPGALLDGWKLGALMPVPAMLHFADDTSVDIRWRALYSLGRMRIPAAGRVLQSAIRDQTPMIRETAAKWLTKRFADTSGLATAAVTSALVRALDDEQPGVRIMAVGSLATFADSSHAARVLPLLADGDPNVRVAAVTALGAMKGSVAARALNGVMDKKDAIWAMKRAGMAALAHVDTLSFARRARAWLDTTDFRDRIAALQAWGSLAPADPAVFRAALADKDPRVQAAALDAWRMARRDSSRSVPAADTALAAVARGRLTVANADVRAAAAAALRGGVAARDLDSLVSAWRMSQVDPESSARLAVFETLRALVKANPRSFDALDDPTHRAFLERPADPVLLAEADRSWPEVAQRWGKKWPIDTHLGLDDYRVLVRNFLLGPDTTTVTIETVSGAAIVVQLLGHEAPLTVANFLQLVDRHYFDGNRWHRVVPDFVVQDGDKTGTGNGGPGWSIRDEINRERYSLPMMGMALSGPDTGGSQWFINLSAQPHLDGQYTIFGKVTGSYVGLSRISQGDVIRSIHR